MSLTNMHESVHENICESTDERREADFDLLVIGAGPGGYEAALEAARLGKKVALAERDQVGGTCLNRGCIPTKALMHSVHLLEELKTCDELGIQVKGAESDFEAIHGRKNVVVSQLRDGILKQLKAAKVTVFKAEAVLKAGGGVKTVELRTSEGEVQTVSASHVLIATGSVPVMPPIPGADQEGVVTSDALLEGEGRHFDRLIIVGGGVIGVEMAVFYRGLGCQVIILEGAKQILPNLELELSRSAAMVLKKKGIEIHTSAMVRKITKDSDHLTVTFEEKGASQDVQGDGVLLSVGRRANLSGLFEWEESGANENCESRGSHGESVLTLETVKGAVKVDENFETSLPGVYAIGDVVSGNVQLAHVATAQGIYVVRKLFGEGRPLPDLRLIPSCIYMSPEIASVGMSLEQAKAAGISAKEHKCLLTANGKSLITREERSFMKVIYEEGSEKILGAVMMCARATDMISEFSLAIHQGLTLSDLAQVMRPHPTYEEAVTAAVTI